MKAVEIIAKMEDIKLHPRTAPEGRELAKVVIQLTQQLTDLRYKVAIMEGKPLPPGTL